MTNDDAEPPEIIAFAVTKRGRLYVYEGDDTTDFPVHFDGVNADGRLSIDNQAHRITSQLAGTTYYAAPWDSDDAARMRELVDLIREDPDNVDHVLESIDDVMSRTD